MSKKYQENLDQWIERENLALEAVVLINRLWAERSVELLIFRRSLANEGPVQILKHHRYARQISKTDLEIRDTLPLIRTMSQMELKPSRIDLGRLMLEWREGGFKPGDEAKFLDEKLTQFKGSATPVWEPRDVVLYGFGRIGRLLARILIDQVGNGDGLRLRAVVCRGKVDLAKRVTLLKRDSVHGSFRGNLTLIEEEDAFMANGCYVKFICADHPSQIDYTQYGIQNALVIDNTGVWRDRDGLSQHLQSKGVDRVLLTAPGKGNIPNIVYGVNTRTYAEDERIFSAASCTTNAIVPPLKVLNDAFGIKFCHIETVHSFTNDQNLLDNYHKKERRGRSAPLNMVITETGAASAVSKALPELTGCISGNAVRVPTANVSLAILNLDLKKETNREEINETLRKASLLGPLVAQIDFTRDEEVVSTDMVGNTHPAIVDSLATICQGNRAVVYVWYDNEYGYSVQVVRLGRIISGVEKLRYY
ncbi:MAG: glyceraldehyde-3-phosphate dehydrogenase [Acidobacteria bacterium]|nr:glyceraldehyde-3-phosphate dehydrogenase [Acidobacteriota bacterium]MCB9396736.1 glyceraldehyde-3-phosphate dehydrogenase [Acidobacteriota bacterium]